MNLPICINCNKKISEFNVVLEHHHEDVDGKDLDYDWASVFCSACGDEVWFEELEDANINDLDKAIRRLNNEALD